MTAWTYLANNGPSPSAELDHRPTVEQRKDGIRKFNPGSNAAGSSKPSGGMNKTAIFYIDGKHDPRTVIKIWLDENEDIRDRMSDHTLHWRICKYGEAFKKASREFFDNLAPTQNSNPENNGHGEAICPYCKTQVERTLPDHLPNCEATP